MQEKDAAEHKQDRETANFDHLNDVLEKNSAPKSLATHLAALRERRRKLSTVEKG